MATNTISIAERKNQQKGRNITILVHLGLLLLVLFPFLNMEPPEPQAEQFVVIDFKNEFKSAAEKSSTKKAAETKGVEKKEVKKKVEKKVEKKKPVKTPKPKPTPKPTAKKKPLMTSDKPSKPIATKPNKADKKVDVPMKDPTPEVPEEPVVEEEVVEEAAAEEATETKATKPGGAKEVGKSDGNGEGQSGSSETGNSKTDGVANQGNNGMDFSGEGIFNRKVIYRADVKKITREEGKIVMDLCINQDGRVVYAKVDKDLSTIKTTKVLKKASDLTIKYRFERDRTAPKKQCGTLTYVFEIEEE